MTNPTRLRKAAWHHAYAGAWRTANLLNDAANQLDDAADFETHMLPLWQRAITWRQQGARSQWSTAESLALFDCVDRMLDEHIATIFGVPAGRTVR